MRREKTEGPVNEGMITLKEKLSQAKEDAEKAKNFFTFKDCDASSNQVLMFPLDGEFKDEERGGYMYSVYRPSVAVLLNQKTGEPVSVKKDYPAIPSSTYICGMMKGREFQKGCVEKAMDNGDTYGCLYDHVAESYTNKKGEDKTYHKMVFTSHGKGDDFISRFVKKYAG